ncbi:MAG: DUF4391 domain-containing protein [Anaerolineaceae bacterium]|nr:DUF4391 domain-containing protein [Anaerolineaceae bacterium]
MILFPGGSTVGRTLPKEAFYKHLSVKPNLKEKFITDIRRITVENSLTENTLHLKPGTEVIEILVLGIDLKKQPVDERIFEYIARQNKHHILFWLRFEGQGQLALYLNKFYKTSWQPLEALQLETKGFTLDEVWNGYVEQIALHEEPEHSIKEVPVTYRLRRQEEISKLNRRIEQLEKAARSEKQPKKKFEMAMQVQKLKQDLDEL